MQENLTERVSNQSSSLPLGKRALSATACWRRNASSIKSPRLELCWKGRSSACPLLANFFSRAGSFGDPIPHVYRCPQTSLFQHLSTFEIVRRVQVCDPPIHWVGLSYRSFPYLLKPYQTSDPSLVCRLKKALYGLKQAPRASVCKIQDGHAGEWSWIQTELVWSFFVCLLYGLWYGYFFGLSL